MMKHLKNKTYKISHINNSSTAVLREFDFVDGEILIIFCGYQVSNLYVHDVNEEERINSYKITENIPNQLMQSLIQFVKKPIFSF